MKVFISWSGERSRLVAELLSNWLKCVIQAVDPWISSKDIDRGALWFTQISESLADTTVGIVCVTQDNKNKPWILFEAGALAKGLSSNRVCTILIDLVPNDIEDPLAQFNHTLLDRDGILKLVHTINRSLENARLRESILEEVFDAFWPKFDKEFKTILDKTPMVNPPVKRKESDLLADILTTVRNLERNQRNQKSASTTHIGFYSKDDYKKMENGIMIARQIRDQGLARDYARKIIYDSLEIDPSTVDKILVEVFGSEVNI